ncbi:hypothetical protein JNUCC0626_11950 [Lentzea sp. JNUCC 0626]|uniref:hypothetical protein n=1 Tax=Lentzea sp. JNUCC 0626 TaxID=3367513 RepID=UPI00374926C6
MDDQRSPLAGTRYASAAHRLWRWVDAPQDAEVADFVARQASLDVDARTRLRAGLTESDLYTLITFARRSALATLRTNDPSHVSAGFEALAAIDLEKLDWRDVSWAAAVVAHAGQRVGVAQVAATAAASRADGETADLLLDSVTEEIDLAGDWGLCEVTTADGVVYFQTESGNGVRGADLGAQALAVAGALEADLYPHAEITVGSTLHAVWLDEDDDEAMRALRGLSAVVSVHAEPAPDADGRTGHFVLVYLAEAASAQDAVVIAAAARAASRDTAVTIGVAVDRRCGVLIGRTSMAGTAPLEDEDSIARFEDILSQVLQ